MVQEREDDVEGQAVLDNDDEEAASSIKLFCEDNPCKEMIFFVRCERCC